MKYLGFFRLCLAFRFINCDLEPFITGGQYVRYNEYPHSVYINLSCKQKFLCGGSILNQNIVLSAAHCVEDCERARKEDIQIKYGHENLEYMKTTIINKYVYHHKYDTRSLNNDICLLSTSKRIPLTDAVKRVILMRRPPQSKFGYVAGWGVDEKNKVQKKLKYTDAQIQNINVCKRMGNTPKTVFCAGPISGAGTAAEGDSGSALVVKECIQIGIVSFKMEKYSLVAYTNVTMYIDWIQRSAKRLACSDKI